MTTLNRKGQGPDSVQRCHLPVYEIPLERKDSLNRLCSTIGFNHVTPVYRGWLYVFVRFVRHRRSRCRRHRPQTFVHAVTLERLFALLSFLAQLLVLTYRVNSQRFMSQEPFYIPIDCCWLNPFYVQLNYTYFYSSVSWATHSSDVTYVLRLRK